MSKMIEYSRQQLGKPYVFGTSGPKSFDCSGLTKRAAAQIGLDLYHGATTQFNRGREIGPPDRYAYFDATGTIDTLPMNKMAFLFNQDKKATKLVMAHVGFYDGFGKIIQCGGYGGKGVHENPFNDRWFSHWATLSPFWMEKDNGGELMNILLRSGNIGDAVAQLQMGLMSLGYDVGKNTKADGKYGPATAAAVIKFQSNEGLPTTGYWTPEDQNALDNALEEENGTPVNDDEDMVLVPRSLLIDLKGVSDKLEGLI